MACAVEVAMPHPQGGKDRRGAGSGGGAAAAGGAAEAVVTVSSQDLSHRLTVESPCLFLSLW